MQTTGVSVVCTWSCSLETLLQVLTKKKKKMSTSMVQELQWNYLYISSEGC